MSEPNGNPVPYRILCSERVSKELKNLLTRAKARGLGQQFRDAAKEIDYRLRIYPQFGEPLQDLENLGVTIWTATVPPLVFQYVIDEERRLVYVVVPFRALPESGL